MGSSGLMITSPRDPSTTSLSPDRTAAISPRTPTTSGISCARRMIAACDVLPPCSVAKPIRPDRGRCKASIGERRDDTPMLPGAERLSGKTSGKPSSVLSSRSPIASMSSLRSLKYGSFIRLKVATSASITRRTADSAASASLSINRRAASTTAASLSIMRCASTIRCPSCKSSASSRAASNPSCSSVTVTASRRRETSAGTRSGETRRSTTTSRGTIKRTSPIAMPSEAAAPLSALRTVISGD